MTLATPPAVATYQAARSRAAEALSWARNRSVRPRAGEHPAQTFNAARYHAAAIAAGLLANGAAEEAEVWAHAYRLLLDRQERVLGHPQERCTYHGGCSELADPARDDQRCWYHAPSRRWP